MTQNIKRIQRELREITDTPPENCTAGPLADNLYQWGACVIGPKESPYEGKYFKLMVDLPIDYPFRPPVMRFEEPLDHPAVDQDGVVRLDALCGGWAPTMTVGRLLTALHSALRGKSN